MATATTQTSNFCSSLRIIVVAKWSAAFLHRESSSGEHENSVEWIAREWAGGARVEKREIYVSYFLVFFVCGDTRRWCCGGGMELSLQQTFSCHSVVIVACRSFLTSHSCELSISWSLENCCFAERWSVPFHPVVSCIWEWNFPTSSFAITHLVAFCERFTLHTWTVLSLSLSQFQFSFKIPWHDERAKGWSVAITTDECEELNTKLLR